MKNFNKIMLITLMLGAVNSFADDIWFVTPQNGQNESGSQMVIQIQPPYQKIDVRVWIESKMGQDRMVWNGVLKASNNYKTTVNISKFQPGRYEVNAEYYIQGNEYDGDVDFWIGAPVENTMPSNNSQNQNNIPEDGVYFPQ